MIFGLSFLLTGVPGLGTFRTTARGEAQPTISSRREGVDSYLPCERGGLPKSDARSTTGRGWFSG